MVESKPRKAFNFAAFIAPCFLLYVLFFITPFIKGIYISLTKWDGLTPKSPIVLNQDEFENEILGKLKKETDKEYLLSVYEFNPSSKNYTRLSLSGRERSKVESIIRKTHWEPENNRFVGLDNYKKILTGKVDEDFYPRFYNQSKYTNTSDLPSFISTKEFDKEVINKASNEDIEILKNAYVLNTSKNRYELKKEYKSFEIEDTIWNLPEVVTQKTVSETDIDEYLNEIKSISLTNNIDNCNVQLKKFFTANKLSESSKQIIESSTNKLFELGQIKNALASNWVIKKFNMGVTGFTLFFAIFSVIGINLLAFGLALALDTNLKGQKIYRTLFFLPNVLSMIIVALIWSMLFVQLLPAITGIDKWISDSAKTPWLLVLVSVWQGAGYYMIIYLAGLQNIPTEIIEAAKIDGASSWQRFRYIKLPLLAPSITVSLFLTIANALKSFDLIYAMIGATGYATGTVPFVMDIYFDAFAQKQAGMATAKAMVLFVVIAIVTGSQLIISKRKEVDQ